jgi:hypothetical protein
MALIANVAAPLLKRYESAPSLSQQEIDQLWSESSNSIAQLPHF